MTYNRELLLHGPLRHEVLSLDQVRAYGRDAFGDPEALRLYGMAPSVWYEHGVRICGRTAVECTRDELAAAMAADIAAFIGHRPALYLDPFAGSCNTLRACLATHPEAQGIGFESDLRVYELSCDNLERVHCPASLTLGSFETLIDQVGLSGPSRPVVVFVAPPWGRAFDGTALDLDRTEPPVLAILERLSEAFAAQETAIAVQIHERATPASLARLVARLARPRTVVYPFDPPGQNYGLLLGDLDAG
jgi:hypothetical protein